MRGVSVGGWLTTRKQVLLVGAGTVLCLLATPAGVLAGTPSVQKIAANPGAARIIANASGQSNVGDVWTDNVGQPAGPGHEQDPHLACADINLWGASLGAASGTYTIDGWQPSGSQELDYSSTWVYNTSTGGNQVTSVIDVSKLLATARANGDAPVNKQGFHFKLQFSLFPQKHKTFWVNCPGTPPTNPPLATFSLSKSVQPAGPVSVGQTLAYRVTETNTSTVSGDGGTVTDTITTTPGVTYTITSGPTASQGTVTGSNPTFSWAVGTLAGGAHATLTLHLTVTGAGTATTPSINNTAINQITNCPDAAHATGCSPNTPIVNFGLAKTVTPSGPATVGSSLTYTVTVTNLTGTAGDPGTVADTITTTGVTYTITSGPTASQNQNSVSGTDPNFSWAVGSLPAHGSATLTLVLKATGITAGTTNPVLVNTAFDTSTNCPTPNLPDCTTNTPIVTFGLAKTVTPSGPATVGSSLTYTVTVTNLTGTAGDPGTVADTVTTTGVSYTISSGPTPSQGSVSGTNPNFSWTVGSLPAHDSATVTLVLKATGITAGTTNPVLVNTAFDTSTNCPTPNLPGCTTNTPIVNFALAKTVTPSGPAKVGSSLTYTVTVTNLTGTAGDPGTVADTITTTGVSYTISSGPTPSQGSVSGTNPNFSWTVGSLPAHDSATVTLVLKATGITAGTTNPVLVNTAFDTSTNCPTPNLPGCTTNTPLIVLTLNKTVDKSTADIGDTVTYTITVTNNSAVAVDNVLVNDLFSGDAGYLVNDGTNSTTNSFAGLPVVTVHKISTGHYQWTYATMASGAVDTMTFTAVIESPPNVAANATGTETLINTAAILTPTGVPPVTVTTTAPFAGGTQGITTTPPIGAGGVQGISTTTPGTGANLNVTVAGFLFLGGIGLILLGMLARKPEPRVSF